MEDQRGGEPKNQRYDDGKRGEIKRVDDRFEKTLVGREANVVVEAGEMRRRADLPVEGAHPGREQPRKDDHRADDDQRRDDEQVIAAVPPGEKARVRCGGDGGCGHELGTTLELCVLA